MRLQWVAKSLVQRTNSALENMKTNSNVGTWIHDTLNPYLGHLLGDLMSSFGFSKVLAYLAVYFWSILITSTIFLATVFMSSKRIPRLHMRHCFEAVGTVPYSTLEMTLDAYHVHTPVKFRHFSPPNPLCMSTLLDNASYQESGQPCGLPRSSKGVPRPDIRLVPYKLNAQRTIYWCGADFCRET